MEVTFWGVRGSIPTPGPLYARWGGNTACLEVRHEGCVPLVLDCGTGARSLGLKLSREREREVVLLFSHLHADHIFGLPFFTPLFQPDTHVHIGVPAWSELEAREHIARYLNGIYHPLRLDDFPATIGFSPLRPASEFVFGGWRVRTVRLVHPNGSLGMRVDAGGASIAYFTDTAPLSVRGRGLATGEPPSMLEKAAIELLHGCDLLVFDAMFDREDALERLHWGHAYPEYGVALAHAAGVKRLVLFHHDPNADDDRLDERAKRFVDATDPLVLQAREGECLHVGG